MIKYPHIDNLPTSLRKAKPFFNTTLYWTYKEDGSNIRICMDGKNIQIGSRNNDVASSNLIDQVVNTIEYPMIVKALEDTPEFVWFVESCRKGRSITGSNEYDRTKLIAFDIFSITSNVFVPFPSVMGFCRLHNIPHVELFATTRHRNYKSLRKFSNYALEHCKAICLEGMVVKTDPTKVSHPELHMEYCQFKTKLDVPELTIKKISKGEQVFVDMPESEVMGAIDKIWQDIGTEKFKDKSIAMPLIAKEVQEAAKQHIYRFPTKLFYFYNAYIERHLTGESK